MDAWFGPFLIACLLLGAAGFAKAVDPTMTVGALRAMGRRIPNVAVRLAGGGEAVLALAAVLTGDPVLALLVAVSYACFTLFVVVALVRRVPIGSCGCFGKVDTPPSVSHLVVNVGAALTAIAVAAGGNRGIGSVLADQPLGGIPFLVLGVVGTYAAFTALTVVPALTRVGTSRGSRS